MKTFDFLIIGGGAAGASAGYELADHGSVLLLEKEAACGMHATGRSAALFSEIYGNATIRTLSRASRDFLETPPEGFCASRLLTPRGVLYIATDEDRARLDEFEVEMAAPGALQRFSGSDALRMVPLLKPEAAVAALYEAGAMDIDVDALHQGYLRAFKHRGGVVRAEAEMIAARRASGVWRVETSAGTFEAKALVNAAGAWADLVAERAGVKPVGLAPKRRTIGLIDGPAAPFAAWPLVVDVIESFYFKPDAGRILVSCADETDSAPCDAQAEDWDVAVAIDRLETATHMTVRRAPHKWAGLRTFAPDRTPVAGFDPDQDAFFWLAGQGGYGIQTAPALAKFTAAKMIGRPVDPAIDVDALTPARFTSARFC